MFIPVNAKHHILIFLPYIESQVQLALHIHVLGIHGCNQSQMKSIRGKIHIFLCLSLFPKLFKITIYIMLGFYNHLEMIQKIHGRLYKILCHFIYRSCTSVDFGICKESWNQTPVTATCSSSVTNYHACERPLLIQVWLQCQPFPNSLLPVINLFFF